MSRRMQKIASPALLAGLAFFAFALPARAGQDAFVSPDVSRVSAGLFCAPPTAGRRDAPGTIAGWVHVPEAPVRLIAEGRVAPAVLGLGFGVRYSLRQETDATLRYTVTHPPMPPRGITEQSWTGTLSAGSSDTVFFQFDTVEELQPGVWTFSVSQNGQPLLAIDFTVVPPAAAPGLAELCARGPLLSASPSPPAAAG